MKKSIGPVQGLYPTPVTVVGTETGGKVNWITVAHIGIVDMDTILVSINKGHYSSGAIRQSGVLSVNLVTEAMLVRTDHVGLASGSRVDKSTVFNHEKGEKTGAPVLVESPLSMECKVIAIFDTETHDNFILSILDTKVDETCLTDDGKIDYLKIRPVLFEMPNRQYLSVGEVLGKCWSMGKGYKG